MLASVIKPGMIRLGVQAGSWEDAVRQGGALLLAGGCIRECYIDAMIASVHEMGPYVVIAKHMALPHAKPEDGALCDGISIISLHTPVNFGNEENDPVKYVFCLSSVNSSNHLDMMRSFVDVLEQDAFYDLLDNSKRPQDIVDFVLKNTKKEVE